MKRIIMIFVLFGFIFCLASSAIAIPSKTKVISNLKHKNWKVKIEYDKVGGSPISFSEDGGKNYFLLCYQEKSAIIWSPDGKYLLLPLGGPHFSVQHIENGYWLYSSSLYDPAKRMLFDLQSDYFVKASLFFGARWAKGSENSIEIKFFDYNWKEINPQPVKITAEEWESKFNYNTETENLYLAWFVAPLKQALLNGDVAKVKLILDKTTCKMDPSMDPSHLRKEDFCKTYIMRMVQDAKKFNYPIQPSKTVLNKKGFNAYVLQFVYDDKKMYCEVEIVFSVLNNNQVQIDFANVSCSG